MPNVVTERIKEFITDEEGAVLKAYRDPIGILTIGVGHTSAAGEPKVVSGMVLTRKQVMDILDKDLQKFAKRVNTHMHLVPQHVFEGALSFDFNTGAIHKASWVKKYLAGDKITAEGSFKMWVKAGGRVLRGLVNRREKEADIIFRNKYPTTHNASVSRSREAVTAYQTILKNLGYYTNKITGVKNADTVEAIEAFQKDNNLIVDGIVGPATRATLERAQNSKSDKNKSIGSGTAGGVATGGAETVVKNPDNIGYESFDINTLIWILAGSVTIGILVFASLYAYRRRGVLYQFFGIKSLRDVIST